MNPKHMIAHYSSNLNGLLSHVIAQKKFSENIIHHNLIFGNELEPWKLVKPGEDIIFADIKFDVKEPFRKMIQKIRELKKEGSKIIFFNNHYWPRNLINELFSISKDNLGFSSTPLMGDYYFPNDSFIKFLIKTNFCNEHNIFDINVENLNDLLYSKYDPYKLVMHISKAKNEYNLIPKDAFENLNDYRFEKNNAHFNLIESYETIRIGEELIINTGLAPEILNFKPGHKYMNEDLKNGINLCFFENSKKIAFRTKKNKKINLISNAFELNNLKENGLIYLDEIITKENYNSQKNKTIENLKKTIEKYNYI